MKKPLLSICIPTYNREKYLKECLESIVHQKWFNQEDIEIVISDNASNDGTTHLVRGYQKKYKNIKYFRNEENIGAVKNILNLPLYLANWEYVWLFWDDDLMSIYWIQKTIDAIKTGSISILLSNRIDFIDSVECREPINNEIEPQIFNGVHAFSEFLSTDISHLYWRYAEYFTFISIMCFRKDIFQDHFLRMNIKYSNIYMDYIYSKHYFPHGVILFWLLNEDSVIWIYNDTLTYTRVSSQWWNMWFNVLKDISDVFIKFSINHEVNRKVYITFFRIVVSWIFPAIVWTIKPYINKRIFHFMKNIYNKIF